MPLILFDIDGTLTQSVQADEDCFVRALGEICGFRDVDTDWTRYRFVTDAGLFHELHEARIGRAPTTDEVETFRQHFVTLLTHAFTDSPVVAVTGAAAMLARLGQGMEHQVALATGAWQASARLKMASAGLCYDAHPAASSDDAPDRESIMKLSRQRAMERFGETDQVVYVGDGVWDARASRALGWPFIGIATGERAVRLLAEGALEVLPDYSDTPRFLEITSEITTV